MRGKRSWTFGQRVSAGFGATVALAILVGVTAVVALRMVIKTKDLVVLDYAQEVIEAEAAHSTMEKMVASTRAYLFTAEPKFLSRMQTARGELPSRIRTLRRLVSGPTGKALLGNIEQSLNDYVAVVDQAVVLRSPRKFFENRVQPRSERLEKDISAFITYRQQLLSQGQKASVDKSSETTVVLTIVAALAVVLATAIALMLSLTLTNLYKQSQEAIRFREDILAIASHDLKNPLNVIAMSATMLSSESGFTPTPEVSRSLVESVRRSAASMNRLIGDLLDLARLEAGKLPMELEPCPTKDLVDKTVAALEPLITSKSIHIDNQCRDSGSAVLCDGERILQVLSNLVGNAIKFTPRNGRITIRTAMSDAITRFSVSDTGPGIPKEQLPYVFERYRQANPEERKRGTGLGLYIAKEIVEAHGGRISVESPPGEGTTFSFELGRTSASACGSRSS